MESRWWRLLDIKWAGLSDELNKIGPSTSVDGQAHSNITPKKKQLKPINYELKGLI